VADQQILAKIDQVMTEVDAELWTWQTDIDMMSFIGQDIPIRVYTPEPVEDVVLTAQRVPALKMKIEGNWVPIDPPAKAEEMVTRLPLVKHIGHDRIVIGIAEVNEKSGVLKATVQEAYAELLGVYDAGSYSIKDEDPPVFDHAEIRAQLRNLINPELYKNPYRLRHDRDGDDLRPKQDWVEWDIDNNVLADPKNHPFFRDDAMNRRCTECERLVRLCLCKNKHDRDGDDLRPKPMPDGEHIQKFYYPEQEK
jgi:hypothetical protein